MLDSARKSLLAEKVESVIPYTSWFRKTMVLIGYRAATDLISKGSTFLMVLFAARFLPIPDFGILSLAFLTGWLIAVASDFGLQILLAREVARAPQSSRSIFRRLLKRRTLSALCLFLLVAGLIMLWGEPANTLAFLLIVAAQVIIAFTDFSFHLFRGLSRSDLESSIVLAVKPLTAVVLFLALGFWSQLITVGLVLFSSSIAGLIVSFRLAWRLAGEKTEATGKHLADGSASLFRTVFPIGAGIVFSVLYFRSDLYLIQWLRGVEAVAHYDAVFRLVDALRLIPAAVLAVIFPRLCDEKEKPLLLKGAGGLAFVAALVALGIGWQAGPIVSLTYGNAFLPAVPVLQILLLALPLLYVNYLLTHQLIAWGKQTYFALFCGVGLVVNLGLNLSLIPLAGLKGAAWATFLTEVVLFVCWVSTLMTYRRIEPQKD